MNARDNILRRLHAASKCGETRPASADLHDSPSLPDVTGYYAVHRRNEDAAVRLERFRTAIAAAHAEVHDTDTAGWPELLCRIAAAKGLKTLLTGTATPDATRLAAAAHDVLSLIAFDRPVDDWRTELFTAVDAGFTRARSAIAETGSLVLWPDSREPRLLSLVPPVHFVLLDAVAIHADLQQAMTAENWSGNLPTNALLISGPSKTADIQQVLAYGAHGPRELIVLVVHAAGDQP